MFKDRIKELRKAENMSQKEFADSVGLSMKAISLYEQGKNKPSARTINKICEVYNVTPEWLKEKASQVAEAAEETFEAAKPKVEEIREKIVQTAEKTAPAPKKAFEPVIIVESGMGGQISVQEIKNRVKEALGQAAVEHFEIYVKPEENKAYYTSDAGNGDIDLW